MDKKKKPIEDEALDQVTGGDFIYGINEACSSSPNGEHWYEKDENGDERCIYCGNVISMAKCD